MSGPQKHSFIFVCKTYAGDFKNFCRLFDSYLKHNADNIPFYISVPRSDIKAFKGYVGKGATLVSDESYAKKYFSNREYWGLSLGYINQEICKLSFWENGFANNQLFIDSDAYFIRDFYLSDFMADKSTPYSVLVMDKDLNTQHFYKDFGKWRLEHIKRIFEKVGYDDRRYRTCHGMTILNSAVLEDFKTKFMKKNKFDYKELIRISPYEYTWYNAWLQKCKVIDVVAVEPLFKTFHMRKEYGLSRISLINESDLAEYYVGIIMNSNWKPKGPPAKYKNPSLVQEIIYKIIE